MKITELEILKVPPSWVWLKLHTDEGVYGLGEPYLEGFPDSVIAEVRRLGQLIRQSGTTAPIAAGERWMGKWIFFDALSRGLLAVVQPDICHAGGST